jgi:DNA-binding PadR family transcriptional regulator
LAISIVVRWGREEGGDEDAIYALTRDHVEELSKSRPGDTLPVRQVLTNIENKAD